MFKPNPVPLKLGVSCTSNFFFRKMIILLLPLSYTAQNLPAGYPLPYNPLVWATQLVRSKPCPGYFGSKPCSYQAIAQVPDVIADVSWSCLAGAFCLGKGFLTNCTAGN